MKVESIIKFTKDALENIENLDNIIDEHIEGVKDYTDTASDLIGPIKTTASVYRFVKTRKFKAFLKTYAKEISSNRGMISENSSESLKKFLKEKRNLNTLYESIDASINSNSEYSAMCIGHISGMFIGKMLDANNKTLIIINAFKNLNDFELFSSASILKSIDDYSRGYRIDELEVVSVGTPKEYTIEKLKTLQIVEDYRTISRRREIGGFDVNEFYVSDLTELFIDIIDKSGVYRLMKNDYT